MNDIGRKVLFILCIYLLLMLVVSGTSILFSLGNSNEQHIVKCIQEQRNKNQEQPQEIIVVKDNTVSYQKELPFDFSMNVITEIGEKTAVYKTYPIHQAEPHNLMTVAEKVTVTSPFGFDIKITEENEEEQSLLHSYSSIGYLTNYNYIEEIEKRKTKFWHKRKFVLCFIKNRIKILKSKKFWFKNKK